MSSKRTSSSSSSKSKKPKTDIWTVNLAAYMKQRRYEDKSTKHMVQTVKEFILHNLLDGDLVSTNSFTFSNVVSINNNHHLLEQHFNKFSQFVQDQDSSEIRKELKRFYGPIICHLCIELLASREPKSAMEFLKRYAHLVAPVETYDAPLPARESSPGTMDDDDEVEEILKPRRTAIRFIEDIEPTEDNEMQYFAHLIETLSTCWEMKDVMSDAQLSSLRSSKYEIHTTQDVVNALVEFLEKQGHVVILNLIITWIRLHIIDNEISSWTEAHLFFDREDDTDLERSSCSNGEEISPSNELPTMTTKELSIPDNMRTYTQKFLEAKNEILNLQNEFCRIIKLADRSRGLVVADVDSNECHVVAGFNNSDIQLWQLNQQSCLGKSIYSCNADMLCNWELNKFTTEDEDDIDAEIEQHAQERKTYQQIQFERNKCKENSFNDYGGIMLRGHGGGVTDLKFSAHFPVIYSASKDTTVRCWKAESLKCAAIYRGHQYPIWCLDESPVRMYLATGSKDMTARIWTLDREYPQLTFTGHTQDVECIALHPNGNYFATGSPDLSVRLWCISSGKLMRVFHDFKQPITAVKFSPDGRYLAAAGEEMKIHIFDLAVGAQFVEFRDHSAPIASITWNDESTKVASVCNNGSFYLWNVDKVKPLYEPSDVSTYVPTVGTITKPMLHFESNCKRLVKVKFRQENVFCSVGC